MNREKHFTFVSRKNNMRKITLDQAKSQYLHRFTMEHIPNWALKPNGDKYYAPQYSSDREWYNATTFPGENGLHGNSKHCESGAPTWPLGQSLTELFTYKSLTGNC
jgi:hypothetical protein